ncbi:MAG: LacI family DNA-binding transcriptional regulator [Acidimicrobiia bacterium]
MTIRELADRLGMAPSSISRALNDHPDVSADTRRRVLDAAEELGYEPDFVAQSLRRGATMTVGFVLRDLSNPLFAGIVKGTDAFLHDKGYSLILTNSDGDPDLDIGHIRLLRNRKVDGLVVSLQSEQQPGLRELLASLRIPVVLIDREVEGLELSAVHCDHQVGIRAAVDHLLELGHRDIAIIPGPLDVRASRERVLGYQKAFQSRGLESDERYIRFGPYSRNAGYDTATELLESPQRPSAIIAGPTHVLTGVLSACRDQTIAIGRDLSLVGCDEIEMMEFVEPGISVVKRDALLIGRLAAEVLLDQLTNNAPPRKEIVPTEYVPRASVAPPPAG